MIFSFPFVKECYENRAWGFAHEHCRGIGARMCTEEEALAGVGAFKGCNFNSQYIWTSTECLAEASMKGYKMVNFKTRETQCSLDNPTTKGRFSCCADASICSTCTDVPQTPENQCQIWSDSGYCADGHQFKSYMRQKCARTCGFDCTITDTTATTTTQTTISVSTTATSKTAISMFCNGVRDPPDDCDLLQLVGEDVRKQTCLNSNHNVMCPATCRTCKEMTTASTSTTSTAPTSTSTSTSTFTPTVPTSKIISGTTSRLLPPPPPTSTTASAETVKTTSTAISPPPTTTEEEDFFELAGATETESAPGSTVSTRTSEAAAKPTDATSTATTRPVEIVVTKQAGSPTNPLAKGFNVTVAPTLSGSGDSIASTLATTLATTTFATSATTLPSDLSSTLESQALISAVVTVLLVAAMVAVSIKWACAAGKCKRTFMATRSSSAIVRNPAWTPTGTPESTPPGTLKEDTSSDSSNLPIESSLHVAPAYTEPTGTLTSAKYAEPDEGSQTQHVEYAEPEEAQYEEYNKGDVQIAMHASSANSTVPNVAPFDSTGSSSTAVNGNGSNRQNPKIVQIYGDVRDTDDEDDGGDPNTACDASIANSSGFDDGPPLPAKGAADWSAYDTTINTLYSSTADVATASGNPNDYEASGSTFTTSAGNDQSASSWAGYDTTANVLYSGTGPLLGGSQLEDTKDARPRTLPSTAVEGLTYATIADVENGSTNEAPLSPSLAANAMRLKLQKVENENYMLPSSSTSPVYDVDRNGPVVDTVPISMYASTENALSTGKAGSDCQVHDNAFEPNGLQVEKGVLRVKSARRSNPLFSTDATYAVPLKKSERRKPEDGTKGVAPANNATASSEYEMPWGFAEQHTMEQRTVLTNQGISSASLDTGARAYDAFSEDQLVAAANQSRRPYDGFGKPTPQNDGASVYNILGRRHVDQPASTTKCVRVSRHGKKKKKKKEKKKEKKEKKEKKKQNKKGKGGKDGGPSSSAAPPIDDGGSAVSWAVPSGSGEGTFVVVQVPGTTRTELFYSDTRSSVSSGGEGIYQNAAFAAEHVMHQSDFWFAGAVSRPVCNKAVLSAVPGSFWVRCSARADNPRGYVLCINDYGGASNFQIVAAKDGLVFAGHRYNCVSNLLYALREAPLQSRNRPGALLRLGDPAPGGSVLHELAPERSPAEAPEHTYSRLGNFDGADVDDADGPSEIMVNDTVFRSVAPDPSVYAEFGGEGEAVEISDDEDWA